MLKLDTEAEELTGADALHYLSIELEQLKIYADCALELADIYAALGPALRVKQLTKNVKELTERAADVKLVIACLKRAKAPLEAVDAEVEALLQKVASELPPDVENVPELRKRVLALASIAKIWSIAESCSVEGARILEFDSSGDSVFVSPDDYITSECGIYSDIDRCTTELASLDGNYLHRLLHGVLLYNIDQEFLENRVLEIMDENQQEADE